MNHPWHARILPLLMAACLSMLGALQSARAQTPPAQTPAAKTATAKSAPACDRSQFRVILDVGHSAEVPGAMSARGVGEYTYNLALAQVIEKKLLEAGFSKTHLLITPGKAIAGLVSRVHYASHNPADLFLAIHHDAVPDKFLEKWTYEGKPQFYCDRFKGHSLFVSRYNADYPASLQFAKLLGKQLKSAGMKYASHYTERFMGIRQRELVDPDVGVYRFDNLVVLMSTQMPAVLLEAGSIINRDEELQMASPAHKETIANAVTTAVENFCVAQQNTRKPEQRIARRPHEAETRPAQLLPFPALFGQPASQ